MTDKLEREVLADVHFRKQKQGKQDCTINVRPD